MENRFEYDTLPIVREYAKKRGWDADYALGTATFNWISPAGRDFCIEIEAENLEELIKGLEGFLSGFDVSEEAYIWLDSSGHGKNGAPYDMRDVYNDMENCEISTANLLDSLITLSLKMQGIDVDEKKTRWGDHYLHLTTLRVVSMADIEYSAGLSDEEIQRRLDNWGEGVEEK